ncbi:hypothetical protein SAY87_018565 [Trapa incisa]|uniref:Uncharacterized protein n=1 Tax=Trapa incisa TaxID=236973 RepID=A0AAN7KXU1_9MYRT|nr:hypothetical protein SAY87_018565 [Trapa incisa]
MLVFIEVPLLFRLLTPPDTPLFPSMEKESEKRHGSPKAQPTILKSRLGNAQAEHANERYLMPRQPVSSPGLNSSVTGARRPSSSGGPGSRPASPASRSTVAASSKPSRSSTPTSRPTLSSTRSIVPSSKPSQSTTKPAALSTKPTIPPRSSTPSRSTARSSTPTSKARVPPPKPASRSATPTRQPSNPSSAPTISVPLSKSSSLVGKLSAAATSRNPVPSCGASPTVKPRPWKPSEMPGFASEVSPNLRTSLHEKPLSATRGRLGAPSSRSSSIEPMRPRRQSCSPSRGHLSNGVLHPSGSSVPAMGRNLTKINDNVSPVLIGSKMVERVVNMRKLAPPRQEDKHSPHSNLSGKSASSPDSSGFGLTLSKKSLDMAIRHMDIRRIIPGNLQPLMKNMSTPSIYSVRPGPGLSRNSRTMNVLDSPLVTSNNANSEVSTNNNGLCGHGPEIENDMDNEKDRLCPAIARGQKL